MALTACGQIVLPTRHACLLHYLGTNGIVGGGVVGQGMAKLFGPDAVIYDTRPGFCQDKGTVNGCSCVFVCVPTPPRADGACDTSAVEEVVGWVESPLVVIRSTIPPGTTDRLAKETGKRIVFQPEYLGETPRHPYRHVEDHGFIVLGGDPRDTSAVADIYKRYFNASVRYFFCDARTAELAKYMENAFFATKVAFVNEFYDIAARLGVSFNVLREIWLADSRINPDHTDVYPDDRGFSGKCLPKDLSAIIALSKSNGYLPLVLSAVSQANRNWRQLG